jgi:hypothetical protein
VKEEEEEEEEEGGGAALCRLQSGGVWSLVFMKMAGAAVVVGEGVKSCCVNEGKVVGRKRQLTCIRMRIRAYTVYGSITPVRAVYVYNVPLCLHTPTEKDPVV